MKAGKDLLTQLMIYIARSDGSASWPEKSTQDAERRYAIQLIEDCGCTPWYSVLLRKLRPSAENLQCTGPVSALTLIPESSVS